MSISPPSPGASTSSSARRKRKAQARESEKAAEPQSRADDMPLRRVVAAALLDVAVRHGDPYSETLAAAKALAPIRTS